ncbi:hypothetical protein ACFO5K_00125 [Nocardia halotolerans]|uniref:Uncharacterized protein n=1 Tax=Nocardia halotolerans TaxID=1755878 RepID=A0ABV8VBB3_9NOCA
MTSFSGRIRTVSLLGGVALLTGTAAGVASATPGETPGLGDPSRTIVLCVPPRDGAAPGALTESQRVVLDAPGAVSGIDFRPAAPALPGADAVGECTGIDADSVETGPAQPTAPAQQVVVHPPRPR